MEQISVSAHHVEPASNHGAGEQWRHPLTSR